MSSQVADARAEIRRTMLEIAEASAAGWERRREFVERTAAPVRAWLVRELKARPGDTVLELGAGAGDTGFEVAAGLGEGGRLICSDFSPAMLDTARRRAAGLGLRDVEFRVVDGERPALDDASVDRVLCRFAYMLMADPDQALRETRRILRPGGRVALAVWGPPQDNPFFATIGGVLVARGHVPPPDPSRPGVFAMGDAGRTRARLEEAGFPDVRVEAVGVRFEVASVDEYLAAHTETGGPVGLVLRGLPDGERAAIAAGVEPGLARFAGPEGYVVPGVALCAAAARPA
jgi:SAM-dependent methyltransferase